MRGTRKWLPIPRRTSPSSGSAICSIRALMLWLPEPRALGALLLVLAGPSALAQAPGAASPPVRIVVYQFTIAKNDAELGMVGSAITRAMVQQLAGDPAFLVMSHPRAERNR